MHLGNHGHHGEPGQDPDGEQGEDQDETEEDLNETFPNCDRHSRDDPLRLPNIHGRAATIDTVNGHVLLVVNEEPLHLPPTRGGDQAGCSTAFTLPGGEGVVRETGARRPRSLPWGQLSHPESSF